MKGIMLYLLFQAAASTAAPTKAPEVPAPLVTRVFKAQAELANAQLTSNRDAQVLQEKTAALQSVVSELRKVCGDKYDPQLSPAGDPVCVAKPEPAKTNK